MRRDKPRAEDMGQGLSDGGGSIMRQAMVVGLLERWALHGEEDTVRRLIRGYCQCTLGCTSKLAVDGSCAQKIYLCIYALFMWLHAGCVKTKGSAVLNQIVGHFNASSSSIRTTNPRRSDKVGRADHSCKAPRPGGCGLWVVGCGVSRRRSGETTCRRPDSRNTHIAVESMKTQGLTSATQSMERYFAAELPTGVSPKRLTFGAAAWPTQCRSKIAAVRDSFAGKRGR